MCVYPAAFSALYAHSPGAFVWSEPIHLLTLVSPASCMTIQAIKPRVEHTLFNSYHKKNRSKEDECLPSQGMKRGRAGGGRKRKKTTRAHLITLYHTQSGDTTHTLITDGERGRKGSAFYKGDGTFSNPGHICFKDLLQPPQAHTKNSLSEMGPDTRTSCSRGQCPPLLCSATTAQETPRIQRY